MATDTVSTQDSRGGVMTRVGPFLDRDKWASAGLRCSLERALEIVGTRSAMILMREAFFGRRRFDELAERTGLTDAVAAKRLKELVADGLLERQPYQEPGERTRYEYVLTERGRALFPVMVALMDWGDDLGDGRGAIQLFHAGCGEPVEPVLECAAGHHVTLAETEARQDAKRKASRPRRS